MRVVLSQDLKGFSTARAVSWLNVGRQSQQHHICPSSTPVMLRIRYPRNGRATFNTKFTFRDLSRCSSDVGSDRLVHHGNHTPLLASMAMPAFMVVLGENVVFMSAFWAWFLAQFAKIITVFYKTGNLSLKAFLSSGGMPSSHSALCTGLTTSIAMTYGLSGPYFPIALSFSLIVMYDAAGVRRHAGMQAEVLNRILQDVLIEKGITNTKLKELLGHTPLQVFCGAVLGILVGIFYPK